MTKSVCLLFSVLLACGVSAQKKNAAIAEAPLSKKSVGKQISREKFTEGLTVNTTGKYILVDMFFQACGPCRKSIPDLNALADTVKYPKLLVVAVDPFREDSATMDKFIEQFKIQYPVVTGNQAIELWKLVGNRGYPV